MSLTKFADTAKWLRAGGHVWCAHMHKRFDGGETDRATAVILAQTTTAAMKELPPVDTANRRYARTVSFGRPLRAKRVSLKALRQAAGRPAWGAWVPRPRLVLGAVVDMVLLSRALTCIPHRGLATVEVFDIQPIDGTVGYGLRVVGRDWRIVIAGRRENEAPLIRVPSLQSTEEPK